MYKICQKQSSSQWECRGQNLITTNPITWFLDKNFFSWSLLKSHKFWCCSWLMESYRSAQRIWVIEERIFPKSEAIFESLKIANLALLQTWNWGLETGNWWRIENLSISKCFHMSFLSWISNTKMWKFWIYFKKIKCYRRSSRAHCTCLLSKFTSG